MAYAHIQFYVAQDTEYIQVNFSHYPYWCKLRTEHFIEMESQFVL